MNVRDWLGVAGGAAIFAALMVALAMVSIWIESRTTQAQRDMAKGIAGLAVAAALGGLVGWALVQK